jgi:Fe-S-cluster containining protein
MTWQIDNRVMDSILKQTCDFSFFPLKIKWTDKIISPLSSSTSNEESLNKIFVFINKIISPCSPEIIVNFTVAHDQEISRTDKILQSFYHKSGFKCLFCGSCCGPAPLYFSEIIRIYFYLLQNRPENIIKQIILSIERSMALISMVDNSGPSRVDLMPPCPFLSNKSCLIYMVRPVACRFFGLHRNRFFGLSCKAAGPEIPVSAPEQKIVLLKSEVMNKIKNLCEIENIISRNSSANSSGNNSGNGSANSSNRKGNSNRDIVPEQGYLYINSLDFLVLFKKMLKKAFPLI